MDLFMPQIAEINKWHLQNNPKFCNIASNFFGDNYSNLEDYPFIPTSLLKHDPMLSVDRKNIIAKLYTSGTSSHLPAEIMIDIETSSNQTLALSNIITSIIPNRLPMIITDNKDSAIGSSGRFAGTIGMMKFGRPFKYIDEDFSDYGGKDIIIFGYTFLMYNYLMKKLSGKYRNVYVFHTGGWKTLSDRKISEQDFNSHILKAINADNIEIYDMYGMVEQVGSIYMKCKYGNFHISNYSEILIRDEKFNICKDGDLGIIQTISVLPHSYAGHSLLTEDMGYIVGVDDCPCGWKGKYFKLKGRIPDAELRGCSNI